MFNSDDFKEFLSNDEINRANKIKNVEKRHQFIISRGIVKKLLSTLLRKEADQIEFLYKHFAQLIFVDYNMITKTNSTDGTIKFIESFPDPEEKITLIKDFDPSKIHIYRGYSFIEKRKMTDL